jgi:hypothetical protein
MKTTMAMAMLTLWSSSQVCTLLLDMQRSQTDEALTGNLKAVVPESVRLAPKPKPMPNADTNSDEDHYGNGDAGATVRKPSKYFTIGYAALIGTNREPEDGQS